jgi:hypothetical protein
VPLFAAGIPTFTLTTGSGSFVRATGPAIAAPTITGAGTAAFASVTSSTGSITALNVDTITANRGFSANAGAAFDTSGVSSYYSTSASGSYPFESAGRLILQSRGNMDREILFVSGATPAIRGGVSSSVSGRFMGTKADAAGAVSELAVIKAGIADNVATAVLTVTVPNANHNAAIFLDIVGHLGAGTDASESTRCASGSVAVCRVAGAATVAVASTLEAAAIATQAGGGTLTLAYGVSAMTGAATATQTFTVTVTMVVTGTITNHTAIAHARLINSSAAGVTMVPAP